MRDLNLAAEILSLLNKEQILGNKKNTLLSNLDKHFSDYSDITEKVTDELIALVENNPKMIVEISKDFFTNKELLSKIFEFGAFRDLKNVLPGEQILLKTKAIASIFEMSPIFSLASHLVSERKVILKPGSEYLRILKHLQVFGVTERDRNDIRLLRNAISHKYSFDGEFMIYDQNGISLSRIDELYLKLDRLLSWNLTFFIYSLIYVPKFGVLIVFVLFQHMDKFNKEWQEYFKGIQIFLKNEFEQVREEKERRKMEGAQFAVKRKKEGKKVTGEDMMKFVFKNIDLIAERWKHHVSSVANFLKDLHDKLDSSAEKDALIKASEWIKAQQEILIQVRDHYKENPGYYHSHFGLQENS